MSSIEDLTQKLIDEAMKTDNAEVVNDHVRSLKTVAEAKKLLEPDPIPDPEPSGVRGFFHRHAGDLIKVGGTLSAVGLIAVIEAKGDVIFRSKATKYL